MLSFHVLRGTTDLITCPHLILSIFHSALATSLLSSFAGLDRKGHLALYATSTSCIARLLLAVPPEQVPRPRTRVESGLPGTRAVPLVSRRRGALGLLVHRCPGFLGRRYCHTLPGHAEEGGVRPGRPSGAAYHQPVERGYRSVGVVGCFLGGSGAGHGWIVDVVTGYEGVAPTMVSVGLFAISRLLFHGGGYL